MADTGDLKELTVTCNQCGSSSMERLGPREYKCSHCGAITVVSQQQQDFFDNAFAAAQKATQGAYASSVTVTTVPTGAALRKAGNVVRFLILAVVLVGVGIGVVNHLVDQSDVSSSAGTKGETPGTVDPKLLTLSNATWLSDPSSSVSSGRFVSVLTNHSAYPIQVPQYSMTIYSDGVRGATANSTAPMPRLMPGEYEPVAFVFETPKGDTRPEVTVPDAVQRADTAIAAATMASAQLVHQAGRQEYRLVGLVKNPGKNLIGTAEVMVMLYSANHTLLGFGTGYVRALRGGEQAAVDIKMPTASTSAVASYEYAIDAAPEVQ